jgi:hypothetical protein
VNGDLKDARFLVGFFSWEVLLKARVLAIEDYARCIEMWHRAQGWRSAVRA